MAVLWTRAAFVEVRREEVKAVDFVYMLRPIRRSLMDDGTPEGEVRISEHLDYAGKAVHNGGRVLAGPRADGEFGPDVDPAISPPERPKSHIGGRV